MRVKRRTGCGGALQVGEWEQRRGVRRQPLRGGRAGPPARSPASATIWLKHRGEIILLPPPRLWGPSGSFEARSPEAPRGAEGSERALESSLGSQ